MRYETNPDDPELKKHTEGFKHHAVDYFEKERLPHNFMTSVTISFFVNTINALTRGVNPDHRSRYVTSIMCAIEDGLLIGKKERGD